MKINEIEYQKNYNIIGMQWEKIIARGTMEDGDNFQDCVKKLRSECDQSAQEKIPDYSHPIEKFNTYNTFDRTTITPVEIPPQQETKTPEQAAQELIETATPSNIKWFKHLPEKYPQLKELYQQKLKELTNE